MDLQVFCCYSEIWNTKKKKISGSFFPFSYESSFFLFLFCDKYKSRRNWLSEWTWKHRCQGEEEENEMLREQTFWKQHWRKTSFRKRETFGIFKYGKWNSFLGKKCFSDTRKDMGKGHKGAYSSILATWKEFTHFV